MDREALRTGEGGVGGLVVAALDAVLAEVMLVEVVLVDAVLVEVALATRVSMEAVLLLPLVTLFQCFGLLGRPKNFPRQQQQQQRSRALTHEKMAKKA